MTHHNVFIKLKGKFRKKKYEAKLIQQRDGFLILFFGDLKAMNEKIQQIIYEKKAYIPLQNILYYDVISDYDDEAIKKFIDEEPQTNKKKEINMIS